jgi:hypothetical protein
MNRITDTLKTWIKLWPDIWAVPLTLIGLWGSYYLLHFIDPTIGTFDLGILQALLFTVAILVTLNAVVFLGIEFNDKGMWDYYKRKYIKGMEKLDPTEITDESDFNHITPWQRLILLYSWRAYLLALGVVIFQSLI